MKCFRPSNRLTFSVFLFAIFRFSFYSSASTSPQQQRTSRTVSLISIWTLCSLQVICNEITHFWFMHKSFSVTIRRAIEFDTNNKILKRNGSHRVYNGEWHTHTDTQLVHTQTSLSAAEQNFWPWIFSTNHATPKGIVELQIGQWQVV